MMRGKSPPSDHILEKKQVEQLSMKKKDNRFPWL